MLDEEDCEIDLMQNPNSYEHNSSKQQSVELKEIDCAINSVDDSTIPQHNSEIFSLQLEEDDLVQNLNSYGDLVDAIPPQGQGTVFYKI